MSKVTLPTSYEVAEQHGFIAKKECRAFKELLSCLDDGSYAVNIGAGPGTSGLILREASSIKKSWTIDFMEDNNCNGNLAWERRTFAAAGFEQDIEVHEQILSDSAKAGTDWTGPALDILFIDGAHSYDGCCRDINAWLPHMKDGGVVLIHDYHKQNWPGVALAVSELMNDHEHIWTACALIAFRVNKPKV